MDEVRNWGKWAGATFNEVDAEEEGLVVLGRFIKENSVAAFQHTAIEKGGIPTTPCTGVSTY